MRTFVSAVAMLLTYAALAPAAAPGYKLIKSVPVAGDGGWDYLIVDEAARRVYVSHADRVEVLDADTYEIKGQIADTKGVHGIALAPAVNRGFTSNGKANTVTVFDLKTLKTLGEVPVGKNPDAILYDPASKQVFAFNGGDGTATVIDAAEGKVVGTVELGGRPESAVSDGAGTVFVNLEDKSSLVKLDARKMKVLETWPLEPGKTAVSLAIDPSGKRLFVGCRNKLLVVVDSATGKVVAHQPIGERVDASAYDPETKLVFCSCGDGTVAVIRDKGSDEYELAETIKTRVASKTMALDGKTHRLFLPAADFKAGDKPKARPTVKPGTFEVLVFGK